MGLVIAPLGCLSISPLPKHSVHSKDALKWSSFRDSVLFSFPSESSEPTGQWGLIHSSLEGALEQEGAPAACLSFLTMFSQSSSFL